MHEERNEGVRDVVLRELEMVAFNLGECDFLGFVESLKSDQIVLVEVTVLKWHNTLVLVVESLEPFGLLWVDHSVLGEHDEHERVEVREFGLFGGTWSFLIVKLAEEDAGLFVSSQLLWIAEISSWSEVVLDDVHVDEGSGNFIDNRADTAREAVWNVSDTHVWSANGEKVTGCYTFTVLDDVTGDKGSL